MKKKNKVGRKKMAVLVPAGTFTMAQWLKFNLGNKNEITMLTLRLRKDEFVSRVKGDLQEPNHKKGLGRKQFVFRARAGVTTGKSVAKAAAPVKTGKSKSKTITADALDATKKSLGIETPAQSEPVQVHLDETPAPVEAPVETPEAAPVVA